MKTLFSMLCLFFAINAHATANGGRGGGNHMMIREDEITDYINDKTKLRHELRRFFENLKMETVPEGEVKAEFESMIARNVLNDIDQSIYQIEIDENQVKDSKGFIRAATTDRCVPVSTIHLNLPFLLRHGIMTAELVGLIAHETARHFCYEDSVARTSGVDLAADGEADPLHYPIANFVNEQVNQQMKADDKAFHDNACDAQGNACIVGTITTFENCKKASPDDVFLKVACLNTAKGQNDACILSRSQCLGVPYVEDAQAKELAEQVKRASQGLIAQYRPDNLLRRRAALIEQLEYFLVSPGLRAEWFQPQSNHSQNSRVDDLIENICTYGKYSSTPDLPGLGCPTQTDYQNMLAIVKANQVFKKTYGKSAWSEATAFFDRKVQSSRR